MRNAGLAAALLAVAVWPAMSSEVACASHRVGIDSQGMGSVRQIAGAAGASLGAAQPSPLFELTLRPAAGAFTNTVVVTARQARQFAVEQEGSGCRLVYSGFNDAVASAVCMVRPDGDKLRWGISVTPQAGWTLVSAAYPLIGLTDALGGDGEEDALVFGTTKGGVWRNPGKAATWSAFRARQPGTLAAQFGAFYDARHLFCTAAEDGEGYPKEIVFRRDPGAFLLLWRHYPSADDPRIPYDVTTFVAERRDGEPFTWHDAADWYAAWARTQRWCRTWLADRPDLPAWMRAAPALVRFGRDWLAHPKNVCGWLRGYRDGPNGKCPLVVALCGWEKLCTWVSPDYFPPFPGEEPFTEVVRTVKDIGGHVFTWPSGYHWAQSFGKRADGSFVWRDGGDFVRRAEPHATVNQDGSLYLATSPQLHGGLNARLCGGEEWTRDWFCREVCAPLARRGCEVFQVDQIVGGAIPICWARGHAHPAGDGPWRTAAFRRQLDDLRHAVLAAGGGCVLGFEEPNEHFIDQLGIQDYRDCWTKCGEWASVFNYIYHEYVPTFQSEPWRGGLYWQAHLAVDGQMPFFLPSKDDILGGRPALVNGDFEEVRFDGVRPHGWARANGGQALLFDPSIKVVTGDAKSGSRCLRMEAPASSPIHIVQTVMADDGTMTGGRRYRLSAWLKTERGTGAKAGVRFGAFDLANRRLFADGLVFPAAGTGWKRASADFTMPEKADRFRVYVNIDPGDAVCVDAMALEEVAADDAVRTVCRSADGESRYMAFMHRWVALYHGEGRPFLAHGRHVKPPSVLACETDPATEDGSVKGRTPVLAAAYEAADGRKALFFANAMWGPAKVRYRWRGREFPLSLAPAEIRMLADE